MGINIEDFLDAYGIVAPQILERTNYRFSLARVLMTIHMMKADEVVKPSETKFLTQLVAKKLSLDNASAKKLASELCHDSEHAPDLMTLVNYLKDNTTLVERADCVREIWEIAVCDMEIHKSEDEFALQCAKLLEVDKRELSWLQQVAEETQVKDTSNIERTG